MGTPCAQLCESRDFKAKSIEGNYEGGLQYKAKTSEEHIRKRRSILGCTRGLSGTPKMLLSAHVILGAQMNEFKGKLGAQNTPLEEFNRSLKLLK